MTDLLQLGAGFASCLVVAFLLAAGEAAISRVSHSAALECVESGRRGAKALATIAEDASGYIAVTTFVRVAAETTAAVLATIVAIQFIPGTSRATAVAIAVMILTSFVIVGVSPRTLGRQHAESIALRAAPGIVLLRRVLGPIAYLLILVGNAVTPGKGYKDGPFASEAELRDLVDLAGESRVIEADEREMIHSVFELGDTVAREVMVPRPDMIAIDRDKSLRQAMSLFLRSGFSRLPVVGEGADDPIGILYFKDVAAQIHANPRTALDGVESVMRPVTFVPDSKPAGALLRDMQAEAIHIAVVVDEYGGTAGLVTIEDILEEIVGEISDEYDPELPGVEELEGGAVRVPATMHVDDLGELFGIELEDDDVDTVGGLLTKALGRVPILGSTGTVAGLTLTAERMAGRRHRLASVVVTREEPPAEAEPEPAPEHHRGHRHEGGSHVFHFDHSDDHEETA
ncbi:hemolysin family protein [Mobilicoccus pelagius]|uniref:Putative transporter n=1 Tax=Mobilicoccus pelagius NBRC 104925 TaxID=1089455 RepID=H5UPX1_9MICO|nr:hemolysin family protein [Mobilicoccus pelagius]GAB47776.1 putative transporter [Mobilicoccus pelagius NBRC 104925]